MPNQPAHSPRSFLLWLIPLLLFTAWLGARGLNADALWFDEYWTLYYAGGAEYGPTSLAETVGRVAGQFAHEKNPPGYYMLLNVWGRLAGWTEYAGRALSWLVGLLAATWTYRLGFDVTAGLSRRSRITMGIGAAVAIGGSAFVIDYLHELRVYIFSLWMAVVVPWAYWRILRGQHTLGIWLQAGFVFSVAATLYLHYSGVIILAALALYHLLAAPKNRRWWQITLLVVAGGLLFLPWLPTLLDATNRSQNLRLTALDTQQTIEVLFHVFSNGSIALLALVAFYAFIPLRDKNEHGKGEPPVHPYRSPRFFILWLAVSTMIIGIGLNAVYPFVNHIRYLIVLWPPLALVIGLGIQHLSRIGIHPAVLLVIWLVAGIWNSFNSSFVNDLPGAFPHQSWRELAAVLTERAQPGDVVTFHAGDFDWMQEPVFLHYLHGLPVKPLLMESLPGLQANDEYSKQAQDFTGDAPRVWLGVNRLYPPNFRLAEFERALSADYVTCGTIFDLPDMSLDLYARLPNDLGETPFRFGDAVRLVPVEISPIGDELLVTLGWQIGEDVLPDIYSVALHLVDADGHLIGQADYGLPNEQHACRSILISTQPGSFDLRAVVYNWQTGERLPAAHPITGGQDDFLILAEMNIP